MKKTTSIYKQLNNKKKAFTLIELLIVIAIIGILFIVLVSKVDFATDKAKASGVQTDFRSFQMALDTVAKENAGFNTFGFDTGDNAGTIPAGYAFVNEDAKKATMGDGIRNSYDEGDKNLNGKQDINGKDGYTGTTEVFTGRKIYTEKWTDVWTLVKPGTTGYDEDVIFALESAINKNLDPKLHITIAADGKITMANQARDPWKNEYHGYYITNAEVDKGDRGAIVIYSNGANGKWGSAHSIVNGIVTVTVPGNNVDGKDDYSFVSCYTFTNGYGEVLNLTTGFSPNQSFTGAGITNAPSVVPGGNGDVDDDGNQVNLKCGDTIEDGSFIYIYRGAQTVEEFRAGSIDYYVKMTGAPSWDELLSIFNGDEEMLWEALGVNAETFTPIEPYWSVTLSTDNTTGGTIQSSVQGIPVIIENAAFSGTNIQTVNISDGITEIGEEAFRNCDYLTTVSIADTVTYIGESCFSGCDLLSDVTLGVGVRNIARSSFTGCTSLTTVNYRGTKAQYYNNVAGCDVEGILVFPNGTKFMCSDGIADDICHFEVCNVDCGNLTVTYKTYDENGILVNKTIELSSNAYSALKVVCGTEIFISFQSSNLELQNSRFQSIEVDYRYDNDGVYVTIPIERILFLDISC